MEAPTITEKLCPLCRQLKPADASAFYLLRNGQLNCYCIACDGARKKPDWLPLRTPAQSYCPLLFKQCSKCGEVRPRALFPRERKGYSVKRGICFSCEGVYRKAYNNSPRGREINRAWRRTEKGRETTRRHQRIRVRKGTEYLRQMRKHIEKEYGLTVAEFQTMVEKQGGLCAICGRAPFEVHQNGRVRRLSIDHSKTTGKVRGLLCGPCNTGIGLFSESVARLDQAKNYLLRII
jgi:hypothetical protein